MPNDFILFSISTNYCNSSYVHQLLIKVVIYHPPCSHNGLKALFVEIEIDTKDHTSHKWRKNYRTLFQTLFNGYLALHAAGAALQWYYLGSVMSNIAVTQHVIYVVLSYIYKNINSWLQPHGSRPPYTGTKKHGLLPLHRLFGAVPYWVHPRHLRSHIYLLFRVRQTPNPSNDLVVTFIRLLDRLLGHMLWHRKLCRDRLFRKPFTLILWGW